MSEPENQIPGAAPAYAAPQPQEQPAAEEPARLGPFSRLTGTLFSPGETFADVNRKPTWIAPLLIAVVTTLALSLFFEWRVKPDWDKFFQTMAEKRLGKSLKELPPEQQDQIKKQLEYQKRFATTDLNSPLSIVIAVGRTIIFYVFAFLIPTGIFALGLMLMQAMTTFKKILSVVAWSWCATGLVYTIVVAGSLMMRDSESLKEINLADPAGIVPTNLAVILPSGTSPALSSIAGSFDIFTIWYLMLVVIGFVAISGAKKFKTSKSATLVFGVWAIWILVKAGFAALGFGAR
jgi:Yip1 domain